MDEICTRYCKSRKHTIEVFKAIPKDWECDEQQHTFLSVCFNVGTNKDTVGRTALHLAASFGKTKLIEWLLTKKSQISNKDEESGYTALHRAFFYGQLHAARTLLRHQANLFQPLDNDKLSPLDHLIFDRTTWPQASSRANNEVYVLGSNANYNLGIDNQKTRKIPELLDTFEDGSSGFLQICLDKYHTLFLTHSGQAHSCGLGQGGKLGHDSEFTSISPKKVCLDLEKLSNRAEAEDLRLVSVAVGLHHSLFLANNGRVWSCGMNYYGQLGLVAAPTQALQPKCLPIFIDKNKMLCSIRGISASRFHSVFWAAETVFSCGLNAGALGHGKGEKLITTPKQVTALSDLEGSITMVACSEGATAIATSKGDVYVLHEYQCRRIASKQPELKKIKMIGGNLDAIHEDVPSQNSELQVVILTTCGRILIWSQTNPSLTRAVFLGGQQLVVKDLALSKSCIALVSSNGEAFTGSIVHFGEKSKTGSFSSFQPENSKEGLARWRANAHVKISRIPSITRAIGIECDPDGKNFAIVQAHPYNGFTKVPIVEPSTLAQDLKELLDTADEMDFLHDITFRVGTSVIVAHRFIIYSNARRFYEEFCSSTYVEEIHPEAHQPIDIIGISEEIFQLILEFIYTGSCEFFDPQSHYWKQPSSLEVNSSRNSFNIEDEGEKLDMSRFEMFKVLQKSARKLKIESMDRILEKVRIGIGNVLIIERSLCKNFSRLCGEDFYDVRITCEDGTVFDAHRAILSARVEYFRSMFGFGWMESSKVATVKLPVPSSVFRLVLDYIYEDRAFEIEKSKDITLIMECLVVADQLLISRLVSTCESVLSGLLTLKNVGQLLEFSSMYNASQLKTSCMDFICCNLPAIVELRLWETVSDDVMDELTHFYQQTNRILIDRCSTLASATAAAEDAFASLPQNISFNRSDSSSPRKQDVKRGKARRKGHRKTSESKEVQFMPSPVGRHDSSLNDSCSDHIPLELMPRDTSWVKVDKQKKRNKLEGHPSSPLDKIRDLNQTSVAGGVTSTRERTKSSGAQESETLTVEVPDRSSKQVTLFDLATVTQLKGASSLDTPKTAKIFRKISQRQRKQLEGKSKENIESVAKDHGPSTKNPWETSATSPSEIKSPWKVVPSVSAEPIQPKAKIAEKVITSPMKSIIADEEEKKRNLDRAKSKPLTLTLLEDRAIEELEKFYNVQGVFDEFIVVERVVPTAVAAPVWSVPRSSEQLRRKSRLSSTSGN